MWLVHAATTVLPNRSVVGAGETEDAVGKESGARLGDVEPKYRLQ